MNLLARFNDYNFTPNSEFENSVHIQKNGSKREEKITFQEMVI